MILLLLAYAIKTHSWSARQYQLRKRAGFDDVGHRLGLTTGAQISVCKAGTAMPLTGAETVHERPLLSWKGETRLPDCVIMGNDKQVLPVLQ